MTDQEDLSSRHGNVQEPTLFRYFMRLGTAIRGVRALLDGGYKDDGPFQTFCRMDRGDGNFLSESAPRATCQ